MTVDNFDGSRSPNFAHYEYFLLATIENVYDVTVLDRQVLAEVSVVVERFEIDFINSAVTRNIDAALVRIFGETASMLRPSV